MDLKTTVTVTSPSGFYYRAENEWRGLNQDASAWFAKAEQRVVDHVTKGAQARKTPGEYTAVFEKTTDGVHDSTTLSGVTRKEIIKFQRFVVGLYDEIVKHSENSPKAK